MAWEIAKLAPAYPGQPPGVGVVVWNGGVDKGGLVGVI